MCHPFSNANIVPTRLKSNIFTAALDLSQRQCDHYVRLSDELYVSRVYCKERNASAMQGALNWTMQSQELLNDRFHL